jgi:hypothetical protein
MYAVFNEGPLGKLLRYGPPSPWHRAGLLLILLVFAAAAVHLMARSALAFWTAVGIFAFILLIVPVGWAYAQYWNRRHPDLVDKEQANRPRH